MAPCCWVHVKRGRNQHCLFDGDVAKLKDLLPEVAILQQFEVYTHIHLSSKEAHELLRGLQSLDVKAIGKQGYPRTLSGSVFGKLPGLINPLMSFLQTELRIRSR
jgi:hypothetical protein